MARRNRRQPKPAEEKDEPRRESKKDLKLIPVAFNESVSLFLNHDGEAANKDPETTGKFSIENTSGKDRIWDVTLALDDTGSTDLDETIEIREINHEEKEEKEYKVTQEPKNVLNVAEYLSTLDEETASYSLIMGKKNEIYVNVTVHNDSDEDLKNLELVQLNHLQFDR